MEDEEDNSLESILQHQEAATFMNDLLWQRGATKRENLLMSDVVYFDENGTPTKWLFTSTNGQVKKRKSSSTNLPSLFRSLIQCSNGERDGIVGELFLKVGSVISLSRDQIEQDEQVVVSYFSQSYFLIIHQHYTKVCMVNFLFFK